MNVAIVYDRVNKWGGAERVLLELNKIFPEAPLYTSLYSPNKARWADKFSVRTSFLQRIKFLRDRHELLGVFMPIAFESFDFKEYDLVISVTSEAAKGIITAPATKHICICLTPTRYLWSDYEIYFRTHLFRKLAYPAVLYLRFWEKIAIRRPDAVLAISKTVQDRIKKYYDVKSTVLYPPATGILEEKEIEDPFEKDYFLIVSRLVPYKRIDIAVEALNKLNLNLIVIGKGVEKKYLKKISGKKTKFREYVSDRLLRGYYKNANALIYPSREDFGIAMVEALSHGTPVIAFKKGAASEIVTEGKTGTFFTRQTPKSLIDKLKNFDKDKYNSNDCRKSALRFSNETFKKKLGKIVKDAIMSSS